MKLLQTKDYLLLIDEEAEINEGDTVYEDISGIFAPYEKEDIVKNPKKIVAYYPLTKEAIKLDLPLLPNPFGGVDINIQTRNFNKQVKNPYSNYDREYQVWEKAYIEGFDDGTAQPKQFTLEDMKKAIEMAREDYHIMGYQVLLYSTADEIIQSLSTQQLPKEFIPEYEDVFNKTDSCSILDNNYHTHSKKLKTITNSEGIEILVGIYNY